MIQPTASATANEWQKNLFTLKKMAKMFETIAPSGASVWLNLQLDLSTRPPGL